MLKKMSFLICSGLLVAACSLNPAVPVMGEYDIYEVDIKELSGLCLSRDGKSLLACGDKGVVKSISFDGQASDLWVYASDMEGVTVNPSDGDVYLAIEGAQEVHLLSAPDYDKQSVLFKVQDAASYDNSGLEAVEYYKEDVLFVGSQKGANLWQFRLDGTMVSRISLSDFASEIAGLCYEDETGWLWVVDSKKAKMFVCTVDGKLLATYDLSFVDNAESVCVDRERNCVWVGSDENATKLYRISFKF